MSYKLLAIYFATSHFRQKKPHSLPSANEEKPTYERVKQLLSLLYSTQGTCDTKIFVFFDGLEIHFN